MVMIPAFSVGAGVGSVFKIYPDILILVQIIGAFSVLYIAYEMFQATKLDVKKQGNIDTNSFWGGMFVQTLNAKGFTLLVIIYSQFPNIGNTIVSNAFIVALYLTILSLTSHFIWAWGGRWLAKRFASQRALLIQGFIYSGMLVIVAVWLFVSALTEYLLG